EYSLFPRQLEDGRTDSWTPDVFMCAVSPPDRDGNCSFGWGLWYHRELAQKARTVIAEVDPSFIRTGGDNWIHVSDVDCLVAAEQPAVPLARPGARDDEHDAIQVIGHYVAGLVRDRDTIELGAGVVSESMGLFLGDKHDLGVHSELVPVSLVELVRSGV